MVVLWLCCFVFVDVLWLHCGWVMAVFWLCNGCTVVVLFCGCDDKWLILRNRLSLARNTPSSLPLSPQTPSLCFGGVIGCQHDRIWDTCSLPFSLPLHPLSLLHLIYTAGQNKLELLNGTSYSPRGGGGESVWVLGGQSNGSFPVWESALVSHTHTPPCTCTRPHAQGVTVLRTQSRQLHTRTKE